MKYIFGIIIPIAYKVSANNYNIAFIGGMIVMFSINSISDWGKKEKKHIKI